MSDSALPEAVGLSLPRVRLALPVLMLLPGLAFLVLPSLALLASGVMTQHQTEGSDGEGALLRLACGGQAVVPGRAGEGAPVLAVRPEAIELSAPDAPMPRNGVHASVEQVVFRGQPTRVHMRLDDGEPLLAYVAARAGERGALRPGERVLARWSAAEGKVVADR